MKASLALNILARIAHSQGVQEETPPEEKEYWSGSVCNWRYAGSDNLVSWSSWSSWKDAKRWLLSKTVLATLLVVLIGGLDMYSRREYAALRFGVWQGRGDKSFPYEEFLRGYKWILPSEDDLMLYLLSWCRINQPIQICNGNISSTGPSPAAGMFLSCESANLDLWED